jgi:hypothetical protein
VEDLFQRFEQISANQAVQAAETWLPVSHPRPKISGELIGEL